MGGGGDLMKIGMGFCFSFECFCEIARNYFECEMIVLEIKKNWYMYHGYKNNIMKQINKKACDRII